MVVILENFEKEYVCFSRFTKDTGVKYWFKNDEGCRLFRQSENPSRQRLLFVKSTTVGDVSRQFWREMWRCSLSPLYDSTCHGIASWVFSSLSSPRPLSHPLHPYLVSSSFITRNKIFIHRHDHLKWKTPLFVKAPTWRYPSCINSHFVIHLWKGSTHCLHKSFSL